MTEQTRGASSEMDRRAFLHRASAVTAATAAFGIGGWGAVRKAGADEGASGAAPAGTHAHHAVLDRSGFRYAQGDPGYGASRHRRRRIIRKSASAMSREEIERFSLAFKWAVAKGYFDVFNDEHFDHMRNRQHGVDVQAYATPAVAPGLAASWGYRLLPWHRSFLLEAESMLRAAMHDRCRHEQRDPSEADLVFLPYWDDCPPPGFATLGAAVAATRRDGAGA